MEVQPFRGLRYSPQAGSLDQLVAPPYDVIDERERERLAAASPHNIVRIDLCELGYDEAARRLRKWTASGVLVREPAPALYAYRQAYRGPAGEPLVRWGVAGMVRLSAYGEGVVYPHERTLAQPREDRLRLMRATRAQLSPVFGLPFGTSAPLDGLLEDACRGEPAAAVLDRDGVDHRMWVLTDPGVIRELQSALRPARVIIADGHHRYETALAFRDEERNRRAGNTGAKGAPAWEYVMMVLVDLHSRGLTVLPTHRLLRNVPGLVGEVLVERLSGLFAVEPVDTGQDPAGALERALESLGPEVGFAVYTGRGRGFLARVARTPEWERQTAGKPGAWRQLDVVALHGLALPRAAGLDAEAQGSGKFLAYTRSAADAVAAVDRGEGQAAFLVRPALPALVRDVALAGFHMPQKSTYFYPKLLTGLVMAELDTRLGL
ncbi:MAG: DUF1015 domain-containing protein [Firmicutes bacterium]|nr:DUF1015 domain-containing protein [Bacillota bacterium]